MTSGPIPRRGDLTRCVPCGLVFVAQTTAPVVCRRCGQQDVRALSSRSGGSRSLL